MTPVFVNVFNRLTTTRTLCEQIAKLDGAEVVIIDNDSTWEPLLEWYEDCPFEVVRLRENLGHHAPWNCGAVNQDPAPFYCVTDCDLDIAGVPADALEVLQRPFSMPGMDVVKCGLSLRIDDLPAWQQSVKTWEQRWWRRPVAGGAYYAAAVDTTFAMYQRGTDQDIATSVAGVTALRAAMPYTARHVPWYLDGENLDAENANYFATANASNSWKPNGKALAAPYTGGRRRASRRF